MIQQHHKILEHLSDIGLANASSAFSMITNDRVTFQKPSYDKRKPIQYSSDANIQLLFTPFIGDVLFESFLIVEQDHARKIAQSMMPASQAQKPEMAQAALLELDNIISAALASKLSDILDAPITGDIPRAYSKSLAETEQYLQMRSNNFDSYATCYTRFKLVHLKAEAEFIFSFKPAFGDTLAPLNNSSVAQSLQKQATQEARRFIG